MKKFWVKKLFTFIMCTIMIINLAPLTAMAATYQTTIDGIIYQLDDTTLEATVYDTTDVLPSTVIIPSTVHYDGKTYNVNSIQDQAFAGCTNMTSISIPDGVTVIPGGTFRNCSSLTSVTIPDSVVTIKGAAFIYCTSLTQVTIPANVTGLGENAFYGCSSLTTVIFEGNKFPELLYVDGTLAPFGDTKMCNNGHKAYLNCRCYYCGTACDHTGKTPIGNGDKTHSYRCSVCDDIETCSYNYADYYSVVCYKCGSYIVDNVPIARDLTYDGTKQALVSVNVANDVTITYSLDQYGPFTEALPTGINAGEYRVWFNVTSSGSSNSNLHYVDVTIKKANYDMSNAKWDYTEAFTYDGSPKTVSLTGLPNGVTVKEYTGNVSTESGKYTAKATLAYDSINYNAPVVEDIQWEIKEVVQDTDNEADDTTQNNPEDNTADNTTDSATDNSTQNTTTNSTGNGSEEEKIASSPQTGDCVNTASVAIVLMLLCAGCMYLLAKQKNQYMN